MTRALQMGGKIALAALAAASSATFAQSQPSGPGAKTGASTPAEPAPTTQTPVTIFDQPATDRSAFSFDYGVPSSPSLNLLGQPEDKVTVVNGLKPFIIQLPRVLGADSESGQSLGIDFSPAWLLGDESTRSYEHYTNASRLYRILRRTHIGAAFYEGVADNDPTKARGSRIAVGLSTSLFDTSDPLTAPIPGHTRSAWGECMDRIAAPLQAQVDIQPVPVSPAAAAEIVTLNNERGPLIRELLGLNDTISSQHQRREQIMQRLTQINARLDELNSAGRTQLNAAFQRSAAAQLIPGCVREANLVARYGTSLGLGVGALWNGDPGRLRNFSSPGWVAWASFRHPLGTNFVRETDKPLRVSNYWMIGFSARASLNELVTTNIAATPQVRANVFDGWAGIERLTEASRFALQVGYQVRDTEGRLPAFSRERWRYFASYSQRLGSEEGGMWLRVGYGHLYSGDNDDAALTVSLLFAPPAAANLFGTN